MAKAVFISFDTEEAFNAAIASAVDAALATQLSAHQAELAALNSALEKARESNATADYSAFEKYPDLVALLKKTDMRPGGLPAICAIHIWGGLSTAADIAKAIGRTPKLGEKGDVECTPKIITGALQKLERGLLTANTGVGVKVISIRGKEGNSTVKRIRFQPMVEIADEPSSGDNAPEGEQQAA